MKIPHPFATGKFSLNLLAALKEPIFVGILGFVSILTFVPILTYAYFANSLGSKETVMNRNNTGVILEDRNGRPFYKFYDAKAASQYVPIKDIPKVIQQAVVAAEDKEFYSHPGFSIKGILGAFVADIKHGSLSYGGSTITQQLVKYSLLNSKRNFLRKYQELVLAQEIERRYSKDEILEMYLNSVYFGNGSFGIESAAHTFFNKTPQDIDLAEAAILAGQITAPSHLSIITGDKQSALSRQHFVLDEMVANGMIKATEAVKAKQEELALNKNPEPFPYDASHFAFMVRDQLIDQYGEEQIARSGFIVRTSIDLDKQDFAQKTVAEQVAKLASDRVSNGAAVVIDPKTGEILALVGSKDWNDDKFGKVNVATSLRQPGSSFKPIVYMAAMEKGLITPVTILQDSPTTFKMPPGSPPYSPHDYDGKWRGPVTVRRALDNSLNVPAVEVIEKLGVDNAIDMAERLGISTLGDRGRYNLSLVLGAGEVKLLEITDAYATMANKGIYNQPTAILEIKDKYGKQIYNSKPDKKRIIDPEYPFLIASILSDNATRAEEFGNILNISRPAAVKTGTSENYRDSLTIGFTPSLTVGVWVGNNDSTPMDNVAGSIGAAPIWRNLMEEFLKNTPAEQFTPPDGIIQVSACKLLGLDGRVATTSATLKEYFVKGTEPMQSCSGLNSPAPSSATSTAAPSAQPSQPASPAPGPSLLPSSSPTPAPSKQTGVFIQLSHGHGNE